MMLFWETLCMLMRVSTMSTYSMDDFLSLHGRPILQLLCIEHSVPTTTLMLSFDNANSVNEDIAQHDTRIHFLRILVGSLKIIHFIYILKTGVYNRQTFVFCIISI